LPLLAATRREEVFSLAEKEKRTILDMRAAGKQYKDISAELGIEVSALKVFVHR
jgi:DNA-binding NarL/FixJ family response regulator